MPSPFGRLLNASRDHCFGIGRLCSLWLVGVAKSEPNQSNQSNQSNQETASTSKILFGLKIVWSQKKSCIDCKEDRSRCVRGIGGQGTIPAVPSPIPTADTHAYLTKANAKAKANANANNRKPGKAFVQQCGHQAEHQHTPNVDHHRHLKIKKISHVFILI